MEWIDIKEKWPPEDKDVLTWDGNYYNVQQLAWKEGDNDEIPVFQSGGGCGNRDVILWSFLPNQPERSKREDSQVEFSKEFIDKQNEISLISMLLG